MKIKLYDAVRARGAVQWLMANVGPVTGVQGSSIRSEGWNLWTQAPVENGKSYDPTYTIELNEHVDEDTKLLFALSWS